MCDSFIPAGTGVIPVCQTGCLLTWPCLETPDIDICLCVQTFTLQIHLRLLSCFLKIASLSEEIAHLHPDVNFFRTRFLNRDTKLNDKAQPKRV